MTFVLHTQEHHHIHFFNDFIDRDEGSIVFKFRTSPFVWTCKVKSCSQTFQDLHVWFCHTWVIQVPSDTNFQAIKVTEFLVDGHQIKQALAWVLTWTVPTIDDRGSDRWTFNQFFVVVHFRVTDDADIYTKSWHGQDGIVKCFPFVHRACLYIKVKEITSQFQLCHFKGFVGTSWRFKEKVWDDVLVFVGCFSSVFELNPTFDQSHYFFVGKSFHWDKVFKSDLIFRHVDSPFIMWIVYNFLSFFDEDAVLTV